MTSNQTQKRNNEKHITIEDDMDGGMMAINGPRPSRSEHSIEVTRIRSHHLHNGEKLNARDEILDAVVSHRKREVTYAQLHVYSANNAETNVCACCV